MDLKRTVGMIVVSASLALACAGAGSRGTTAVDDPDSWVEADAMSASDHPVTAVLGYESGPASPSQLEPAPSPEWEVTEGHVTIVSHHEGGQ